MDIKTVIEIAHEIAKNKGWYDQSRTFPEEIALFHAELSEALEEFRNGREINKIYHSLDSQNEKKPEGIPIELADLIIRIADSCAHWEIDLEAALRAKMQYNTKRPYRHGNKLL